MPPTMIDPVHAQSPLVLALDVGTSSTRATVVDAAGRDLAGTLTQVTYRLTTTPDGGAELDPERLVQTVAAAIDGALAALGTRSDLIAAVGISTFWHSLMGVDEKGQALTPVYTWADRRAAGAVERLAARLDTAAYHHRTGAILHASYPLAKLAWLRQSAPTLTAKVTHWLSFGEYLQLTLLGQVTCSISMASGTGLFDQAWLVWDKESLNAVEVPSSRLSPVDDAAVTGLRAPYAGRWPSLARASWFPALGDGACGNVGSGAVGRDRLAVMIGTTGAMRLLWAGPAIPPPPGLWLYRLDERRVLLGGALSEGGNLFDWIRDRFRLPDPERIDTALEAIPPDSHGLTWLPFLAGERSPGWRSDARATLHGLTLDTRPIAVMRAALEAVAYRFALVEELLRAAMPDDCTVIASGSGLLRNPIWMRILADVLNRPVLASREPETSLKGAALMALERLGVRDAAGEPVTIERLCGAALAGASRFDPDPARHEIYRAAIARQQDLYRRLFDPPPAAG